MLKEFIQSAVQPLNIDELRKRNSTLARQVSSPSYSFFLFEKKKKKIDLGFYPLEGFTRFLSFSFFFLSCLSLERNQEQTFRNVRCRATLATEKPRGGKCGSTFGHAERKCTGRDSRPPESTRVEYLSCPKREREREKERESPTLHQDKLTPTSRGRAWSANLPILSPTSFVFSFVLCYASRISFL